MAAAADRLAVEVQVAAGKKELQKWQKTEAAIETGEKETSAEIRVHLTRRFFDSDALKSAKKTFHRLKMDRTQGRNGVLIYINLRAHRFAIFGDISIHEKVGQGYWDAACQNLGKALHEKEMDQAVSETVSEVSHVLKKYFPWDPNHANPNELPNQVSED